MLGLVLGVVWAVALWLFVAAATGDVAASKGYSRAGWLLLGLAFGVFALVAVGFREPRNP